MTPDHWLEESPIYEGWGKAEFCHPRGFVEGPTRVVFPAEAFPSCTMKVENVSCETPLPFGLQQLLSGQEPVQTPDALTLPLTFSMNRCTSLTIQTSEGRFSSDHVGIGSSLLIANSEVHFNVWHGRYDVAEAGEAQFFAIPLLNFLTEYPLGTNRFYEHPLRFLQMSTLPGETPEDRKQQFLLVNKIIVFEFRGGIAFIEPFPDHEERKTSLEEGAHHRRATALFVGDCLELPQESSAIFDYFMPRLRALIALGTGHLAGAPWMEVRTGSNALVCRLHHLVSSPTFRPNRAPVPMFIGNLIRSGMRATIEHEEAWSVACRHAAKAGRFNAILEETLQACFTGLETLNKAYSFSTCNLLDEVPPECQKKVSSILEDTAKSIREIPVASRISADRAISAFQAIEQRVRSACCKDQRFTLATLALMTRHELPDMEIVKGLRLSKAWLDLLGYLRGAVIHEGYLSIESSEAFQEYMAFSCHLRDILVRILLKMASFTGDYQPLTMDCPASEPVEFLKQQLVKRGGNSAQYLGYPGWPTQSVFGEVTLK